jgi:hypothetical protein
MKFTGGFFKLNYWLQIQNFLLKMSLEHERFLDQYNKMMR